MPTSLQPSSCPATSSRSQRTSDDQVSCLIFLKPTFDITLAGMLFDLPFRWLQISSCLHKLTSLTRHQRKCRAFTQHCTVCGCCCCTRPVVHSCFTCWESSSPPSSRTVSTQTPSHSSTQLTQAGNPQSRTEFDFCSVYHQKSTAGQCKETPEIGAITNSAAVAL